MTRITSLGMKRSYKDAQFNSLFKSEEQDTIARVDGNTLNDVEEGPAKKRSKHSKDNVDDVQKNPSMEIGVGKNQKFDKKRFTGKFSRTKANVNGNFEASESRRQRRIRERQSSTTCFACRERGHAARDCPKSLSKDTPGQKKILGICYRCGSTKHSLSRCPKPEDPENPLPFATCFVCDRRGHLVSNCPQNNGRGVYPNGGCCKLCSQTTHLAKYCPLGQSNANTRNLLLTGSAGDVGADEDDFHALQRRKEDVKRDEKREEKVSKVRSLHAQEEKPKVVQF